MAYFRCTAFRLQAVFSKAVVQVWNCNFYRDENRNSERCEMNVKRGKRQAHAAKSPQSRKCPPPDWQPARLLFARRRAARFEINSQISRKTNEDETRERYFAIFCDGALLNTWQSAKVSGNSKYFTFMNQRGNIKSALFQI